MIVRCKHRKTPGDGGMVDGCGWQGERPDDGKCPGCGAGGLLRLLVKETLQRRHAEETMVLSAYMATRGDARVGASIYLEAVRLLKAGEDLAKRGRRPLVLDELCAALRDCGAVNSGAGYWFERLAQRLENGSPQPAAPRSVEQKPQVQNMKCPTCSSPAPHLHPAVQHEGEAQVCADPFHKIATPQNVKLKDPTPSPMPAGGSPLRDQQPARPYYLIERTDLGQPNWLAAIGFESMWIPKAVDADRFDSRDEAETHAGKVRDLMPLFAQHIVVTEHLDVDVGRPEPARNEASGETTKNT